MRRYAREAPAGHRLPSGAAGARSDVVMSSLRLWLACRCAVLAVLAVLAGCGGAGTDGTGPSGNDNNTVSVGVATGLAETTVTVNGVSYERAGAVVSDGFGQTKRADDLRLGMWLEISGVVDEVSGIATAQTIRVRPAARGVVSAVDGSGFTVTVLQSTARYDNAATVIEGADSAAAIAAGDVVEVHGPLGVGSGTVEASRIERLSTGTRKPVELRGRVANLDTAARTLTVGRQAVRYDTAALTLRQALANGQVVRVASLAAPVAGQPWPVERMTSDQPLPDNLGFAYAEGVTTDWATGPTFSLEGVLVNATSANNRGVVTSDGQRVAVIGSLVAGTLSAKSVARSLPGQPVVFVLSAALTDYQSISDFRVRGVTIDATSAAFANGAPADLVNGRRVKVTGSVSGRKLMATKVELLPS
jgi:Domain of unknown function (DUF5666)